MKKYLIILPFLSILLILSCGDEDTCGLNGEVNGDCFQVVLDDYDVQTINVGEGYTRENLFLSIQFDNGSERYGIRARSDQFGELEAPTAGIDYRFQTGVEYIQNAMTFNGNINAPATGVLMVNFSKVDRINGSVSGSFVWAGADTGSTTSSLSGTFTDVAVSLVSE